MFGDKNKVPPIFWPTILMERAIICDKNYGLRFYLAHFRMFLTWTESSQLLV